MINQRISHQKFVDKSGTIQGMKTIQAEALPSSTKWYDKNKNANKLECSAEKPIAM